MVLSRFIIPSSEQKTYMGNGHISHGYEVSNSYTTESTNHRRKFTRLVWRNRNFSLEVGTFLDLVGLVTGIQEIHPSEKLDAARFDRQDGEGYVSMYVSILRTLVLYVHLFQDFLKFVLFHSLNVRLTSCCGPFFRLQFFSASTSTSPC